MTYKPQHKMIAKLIGARNEIEDVLSASLLDRTLLSPAERDRLSSILSLIESLLQDLEEGLPNTSASAARHFRARRRISSSDMSIFICSTKDKSRWITLGSWALLRPTRAFTSGLPKVWSPSPSPDMTSVPTG